MLSLHDNVNPRIPAAESGDRYIFKVRRVEAILLHEERDPVVIAASDVEIGCLHASADVDPAQFARQIDPAVVDVDRVVVGVPLDVERVEQASVVGVTEFVASEAVGPEVNIAV